MTDIEIIDKVGKLGFVSKYVDKTSIDPQKNPQDYFIFLCEVFYWLAHKNSTGDSGEVLGIAGIVSGLLDK